MKTFGIIPVTAFTNREKAVKKKIDENLLYHL